MDLLDDKYATLGIGGLAKVSRALCPKCKLPIYAPPPLQPKIVCCPYCRVEFK